MSQVINGYIKRGRDPIEKWEQMNLSEYPSIRDTKIVDSLVPFYGSVYFDELTTDEKENLYFDFIQFSAEMFIYLEYQLSNDFKDSFDKNMISTKTAKAVEHLVEEEAYHTEAFYKFLEREGLNKDLPIMDNPYILGITTFLIKLSPVSVLISAAKHESYSLVYSKLLKEAYGGWKENSWSYVNYLHLLDEAHHVPFQLELYDEAVQNMGIIDSLRAIVASMAFFVLMQFIAIYSSYKLINGSLSKRSFTQRMLWVARFIKWVLIDYKPTYDSRAKVRTLIDQNPIPMGGLYKALYR